MVMPLSYDRLVEKKLAEREAKGNVSSVKITESECQQEIAAITGLAETTPQFYADQERAVEKLKKKRGRPLGSRNKPKQPK